MGMSPAAIAGIVVAACVVLALSTKGAESQRMKNREPGGGTRRNGVRKGTRRQNNM